MKNSEFVGLDVDFLRILDITGGAEAIATTITKAGDCYYRTKNKENPPT